MADPLDAFPDVVGEDDREEGKDDREEETELLARHQRAVRTLDGVTVDGLVYEYRTQFHRDPLVDQTETAYYLAVRDHVWNEFADRMDLGDGELSTLKRLHADQFRASMGDPSSGEPLILTKE